MNLTASLLLAFVVTAEPAADPTPKPPTRDEVLHTLDRAVAYFRSQVSACGGYLWRYAPDLATAEGETAADPRTTAWVQPPGTPTVGDAYLGAWRATGQRRYLAAAADAGQALARGQLISGGWDYRIFFAPRDRPHYRYRADEDRDFVGKKGRDVTTLDDDTTQAALRFLIRLDQALGFQHQPTHEAASYGLASLLRVQYPNGAWPQRHQGEHPSVNDYPVLPVTVPEDWPRTHPGTRYTDFYTLNDNTLADCVDTLLLAADVYQADRDQAAAYRAAALRGGDFLILAQLPEPQPAWAQQYDRKMQPAWARRFEPPAVTGGESQSALRTLLTLYEATGDEKFLAPIPAALAYFERSRLADGRLARFYELRTNRPLYFTKEYELTYDDSDLPTHYGFKSSDGTPAIARRYKYLRNKQRQTAAVATGTTAPDTTSAITILSVHPLPEHVARTRQIIDALDGQGRWLTPGTLRTAPTDSAPTTHVIDVGVFVRNVNTLVEYLKVTDP